MAGVIKGFLKDKVGNVLAFFTSADQVEYAVGVTAADLLKKIVDSGLASGTISADWLPALVNRFKGAFVSLAAMPPTGVSGDFCINTGTDTVWVWDTDTAAWVETDTKGQVSSVNGRTGEVTLALTDFGITLSGVEINALQAAVAQAQADATVAATSASAAQGSANTAMAEAQKLDIAVIKNGAPIPSELREGGLVFEKSA